MLTAYVKAELCEHGKADKKVYCEAKKVCPTRALVCLDFGEPCFVDSTNCNGCGDCVYACSKNAIEIINR